MGPHLSQTTNCRLSTKLPQGFSELSREPKVSPVWQEKLTLILTELRQQGRATVCRTRRLTSGEKVGQLDKKLLEKLVEKLVRKKWTQSGGHLFVLIETSTNRRRAEREREKGHKVGAHLARRKFTRSLFFVCLETSSELARRNWRGEIGEE